MKKELMTSSYASSYSKLRNQNILNNMIDEIENELFYSIKSSKFLF